jgi:hypothetical protein
MKFHCTIRQDDGQWVIGHASAQVGSIQVRAPTRSAAMEKMRGELQYRLELCPCTGETYRHINIEMESDPS